MAVIFALSAQPDLDSGLDYDLPLRKLAHLVEFGVLWLLWWRALGYGDPKASIAIALLYAVSDEWHQSFVDGRKGSPVDVAVDAAGVGLAGLVVWLRASRARRR